jgi:isopenicillin N synthase-like dioxygenase
MGINGAAAISAAQAASDPDGFAAALGESFTRYGFAVIEDHGLDEALIKATLDDVRAFFALPEAIKRAYHVPGGGGQRGYTPFGVEAAKGAEAVDLKEFWHVGRELSAPGPRMPANLWPTEVAGFKAHAYGLFEAFDAFGGTILRAIARYLGEPETLLVDGVRGGNSILRLLHYPPVAADPDGVRAGAHEDINVITLLIGAEEAGLQLLDRDGRWLEVKPPPGGLVINVGDMLQRLTNHVLPSTTHRVVNPAPERAHLPRYSIPFFQHFAPDFEIKTLASCISASNPDRYPQPITAHEHLVERLKEIRLM